MDVALHVGNDVIDSASGVRDPGLILDIELSMTISPLGIVLFSSSTMSTDSCKTRC